MDLKQVKRWFMDEDVHMRVEQMEFVQPVLQNEQQYEQSDQSDSSVAGPSRSSMERYSSLSHSISNQDQ